MGVNLHQPLSKRKDFPPEPQSSSSLEEQRRWLDFRTRREFQGQRSIHEASPKRPGVFYFAPLRG